MAAIVHDDLDYDIVHGTVYIIQGTHQAGFASEDIILVPTPSSDPQDPLVSKDDVLDNDRHRQLT